MAVINITEEVNAMREHMKTCDKDTDNINHPKHYTSSNAVCSDCFHPIECIDVTRHMSFNIGNIVKYLWRADHKNGLEDLKKAQWYLNDLIKSKTAFLSKKIRNNNANLHRDRKNKSIY